MRILFFLIAILFATASANSEVVRVRGDSADNNFTESRDVPNDTTTFNTTNTPSTINASFVVPEFDGALGTLVSTWAQIQGEVGAAGRWNVIGTPTDLGARVSARTSLTFEVFKNGVMVDSGSNGDLDGGGCFATVCTRFAGPTLAFDFNDINAAPGDEYDIAMALTYSSMFNSSEIGTFLDAFSLDVSASISSRYEFEFIPKPVPLPPAAWLFLSAVGLLITKLMRSNRAGQ